MSRISEILYVLLEQANGLRKVKSSTYQGRTAATTQDATQEITQDAILQELFAENILAKLWRVASRDLENNVCP